MPEVCVRVERDLFIWQKRPIHMAKETYEYIGMPEVRMSGKKTYRMAKETYHAAKETYHTVKETYHAAKET